MSAPVPASLSMDIGSMSQQDSHNLLIPLPCCSLQSITVFTGFCVDIGPKVQKQTHHFRMSANDSGLERVAIVPTIVCVHVKSCTTGKDTNQLNVAVQC